MLFPLRNLTLIHKSNVSLSLWSNNNGGGDIIHLYMREDKSFVYSLLTFGPWLDPPKSVILIVGDCPTHTINNSSHLWNVWKDDQIQTLIILLWFIIYFLSWVNGWCTWNHWRLQTRYQEGLLFNSIRVMNGKGSPTLFNLLLWHLNTS